MSLACQEAALGEGMSPVWSGAVQFPLAPPSVSGALGKGLAAGTENAAQDFSVCTSLYGSSGKELWWEMKEFRE